MKHGKKYQDSVKSFDKQKLYDPREGLEAVLATAKAKFDETIEVSARLGVDPRHAVPARRFAFWFSPRATRPRKHRKPALIM